MLKKLLKYLLGVKEEFHKIDWIKPNEVVKVLLIVLVVVTISSLMFLVVDTFLSFLIKEILVR